MKYSNILRSDLGLSKITDKDEFLDHRVIKHYGSLVPLTELDDSLLRKIKKILQVTIMIVTITTMRIPITMIMNRITFKIIKLQITKILTRIIIKTNINKIIIKTIL